MKQFRLSNKVNEREVKYNSLQVDTVKKKKRDWVSL